MLVGLAALCLPNLFYRATFNIPLLIFIAIIWKSNNSLASQLLIISWGIEFYQLLDILVQNNKFVNPQKNPVLLSFTILVFVLKVVVIVFRPCLSSTCLSRISSLRRISLARVGPPVWAKVSMARNDPIFLLHHLRLSKIFPLKSGHPLPALLATPNLFCSLF